MKAFGATSVGQVRPINEDSMYLPEDGERFAVVADGMGGHQAGEVASAMAIETFARVLRYADGLGESTLLDAVLAANDRVYRTACADFTKQGMGTTLTALTFCAGEAYFAHVGDSRAYLYRDKALIQISTDHSLVEELVKRGELTPEEARVHPKRNYITRALGTDRLVRPDIFRMDLHPGDVWLLCSDGLTGELENREIAEILAKDIDWQQKTDRLVALANERGGSDNITALLVLTEPEDIGENWAQEWIDSLNPQSAAKPDDEEKR